MTADDPPRNSKRPQPIPDVQSSTVQLLVANDGNRRAIRTMLSETFDVETGHEIQDADLYLVEDRLLPKYREELGERVTRDHPVFCPVVIIQRDQTDPTVSIQDTEHRDSETPLLIDEFITAPINRQLLVSRLRSLLVRRQQSLELQAQVGTLERQERELRRFERAVEDGGTPTAITALDGAIEYVNPEFEQLTGYTERDVLARPLERFLADDSRETIDESFWRTMAEKQEWEGELLVERNHGQHRITDTTITPIRDDHGAVEGFVVVMPDITPRIEQEQLLRDREQELDLLRQILSRYLRHNLRNDLNIILGYAELLAETCSGQDTQHATAICDTATRLIERSETAQEYSQVIEQEHDLAPHDVSAIVTDVVSEIRQQYPDVSIELDATDDCRILARDGIRKAIRELIDNAARHNTADSPRVDVTVTDADDVTVTIEDNGPGISDVELETLDQESETPLTHSQGVGLWLSKWVIERTDGQLSFEISDDGGTRVTIEFPSIEQVGTQEIAVSELRAREQRLQTITERMTDAVVEVDAAWEITYVDEQAERILGVDADVVRGRSFWDVFSEARDTRFEAVYRDVMQSRSGAQIEEYYSGIDGWLAVYAYPDFDGGLSFYFRDITDRKEREQELEDAYSRMKLALTVTDAAVWEWDIDTDTFRFHPRQHPVLETTVHTLAEFIDEIHPDDRARVRDAFETAAETGSPYDVEYRVRTDGTVRWAAAYGELQYDDAGAPDRLVGVTRDVTERRERAAELELKSKAMDEAPTGIVITGPLQDDVPMIYANDQFERLTGYSEAEILDRNCRFLQGEHTAAERVAQLREAIEADNATTVELRNYRKDGTEFWNRVSIAPLRTDGTEITHYVGFQQDVTETRESEQYRQRIYELTSAPDTSPDRKIEQLLELGCDLLGTENGHIAEIDRRRQRHTVRYVTGSALVTDGTVTDLSETICQETIETDELLDIRDSEAAGVADGSLYPVDGVGRYVGTKLFVGDDLFGTVCFADREPGDAALSNPRRAVVDLLGRSISQLLQSKREREEREAILNRMTDALFSVDDDWRVTYANDAARTLLNATMETSCPSEQLEGRILWEAVPELVGTQFADQCQTALAAQQSVAFREYYDSIDTWFAVRAYPSASGLSVYFRDVTDEQHRQTAIRTRERTLREMYDIISDSSRSFEEQVRGLLDLGKDAIGVEYGSLSRVEGDTYTFEIVDAPPDTISPGDTVELSATNCERTVLTEETVVAGDVADDPDLREKAGHAEWGITCYLGTPVFADGEVYGTFCFYSEDTSTAFSDWDVTLVDLMGKWISYELNHHRTADRLRQQNERLEQFASLVSHDLRNPLNIAEGRLELAQAESPSPHHEDIEYALGRMGELIDDVLTLAWEGNEVTELEPVDLGELSDACWHTVDTRAGTLVIESAVSIVADRSRLKRLLENLFRNAIEHGGDDVTITVGSINDGFYIENDGADIPEDRRASVFEAGYSTTEDGTGLGLSIVQRVATAHGWSVDITDGSDGGVRFEITGVTIGTEKQSG